MNNVPLPVCARCLGVYAGTFLALAYLCLYKQRPLSIHALLLTLLLMAVERQLEFLYPCRDWLYLRFVTGWSAGAVFILWLVPAAFCRDSP